MKSYLFLLITFFTFLFVDPAFGQNIRTFFYGPTAAMQTTFTGASAGYIRPDSCSGVPTGFSYVFLDAVTAPLFRTMMAGTRIRATYDSLTNVNSLMRRRITTLRNLSNGLVNTIEIHLFDDRTGLPAAEQCKCDFPASATLRGIWPCADNERISATAYLGYLFLGELGANAIIAGFPGAYWAWNETVIHEFSHTQFANEYNSAGTPVRNKWGANGIAISYGGDESHFGVELMADQQMALDEGLATYWGLEHNRVGRDSLIAFLNDKAPRLYLGSHSFLTGTAAMWNAPHVVDLTGPVPANRIVNSPTLGNIRLVSDSLKTGSGYELRIYKWLDVPGEYIFYNEQMFQGYAQLYHELSFASRDTAFNKMLRAARTLTPPIQRNRYPAFLANQLALAMEAYANTAKGRAEETASTLTSSMFPLALFDIITHFGMTDAQLKREFSINLPTGAQPKAFIEYWNHRNAIKQAACPHLGGNNCASGAGNIDIIAAATSVRTYLRDPGRILR